MGCRVHMIVRCVSHLVEYNSLDIRNHPLIADLLSSTVAEANPRVQCILSRRFSRNCLEISAMPPDSRLRHDTRVPRVVVDGGADSRW
jgi:hypothetical protein